MRQGTTPAFAGALLLSIVTLVTGVSAQDYRLCLDVSPTIANPGDTVTARVLLVVDPGTPGPVEGVSFGVCHDPAEYSIGVPGEGADIDPLPCGSGPDFLLINPAPGGYTFAMLNSFLGLCSLGPGCYELSVTTYTAITGGRTDGDFCFCNTLGVNTVVSVAGISVIPLQVCGPPTDVTCSPNLGMVLYSWTNHGDYDAIEVVCDGVSVATLPGTATSYTGPFVPGSCCEFVVECCSLSLASEECCPEVQFIRCDCNSDGGTDLSDAICLLNYIFVGIGPPTCLDASDGNDDGTIDVSDAIQCIALAAGLGAPPAPWPACGADPTVDLLDCVAHPCN